MAVGKSGAVADRDKLTIKFGDITVAENGWVSPGYTEDDGLSDVSEEDPIRARADTFQTLANTMATPMGDLIFKKMEKLIIQETTY